MAVAIRLPRDDIRYFLTIAKRGSARAATDALGANHSTVLRRISHLEKQLGVRLFEELPSGYVLTEAGHEVLPVAEEMETNASFFEKKIYGRDRDLKGKLTITIPTALATHLIMFDLEKFTRDFADIDLEISTSYNTLNLTTRSADVALRLVYDRQDIPRHLYGFRLCEVRRSVYLCPLLLKAIDEGQRVSAIPWEPKAGDGPPPPCSISERLAKVERALTVSDLASQVSATRESMGPSVLPCFVGDSDERLIREPGSPELPPN